MYLAPEPDLVQFEIKGAEPPEAVSILEPETGVNKLKAVKAGLYLLNLIVLGPFTALRESFKGALFL